MVTAILEKHKVRLVDYLSRAHNRINVADESYSKFDEQIKKVQEIGGEAKAKTPVQKRELEVALNDLRKAMIEVIEAEKNMKFMRTTKSAQEIAIEKKILGMEGKLNDYLQYREKRMNRYKELEKKVAEERQKEKLLEPPKPIPEEKLPVKIPAKADPNLLAELKNSVVRLSAILEVLKKDKKHPQARLAELENKLNKYKKRIKDLEG